MKKYLWIGWIVWAFVFCVAIDVTEDLINSGWFVGHEWRQAALITMWLLIGTLSVYWEEYCRRHKKVK